MCTVTWRVELNAPAGAASVELFFNRDESRARGPALPPEVRPVSEGPAILAPTDADAGGTWLAANEHGLVVALLNLYQAPGGERAGSTSRGCLPLEWARLGSVAEVQAAFGDRDLEDFAGFRVLVLDAGGVAGLGAWWGSQRTWEPGPAAPVISSGFELDAVEQARRELFGRHLHRHGGPTSEALERFHASTEPEPGPLAVRMTRPDARTVSTTRVIVGSDAIEMRYAAIGATDGDWSGPVTTARLSRAKGSRALR